MLNWLARLGWSHGDQEIFSAAEMIEHFDLAHVGRSGAQADLAKLAWLNQHYLKQRTRELALRGRESLPRRRRRAPVVRDEAIDKLLDVLRERSTQLVEMAEKARFALVEHVEIEPEAAQKHLRPAVLDGPRAADRGS